MLDELLVSAAEVRLDGSDSQRIDDGDHQLVIAGRDAGDDELTGDGLPDLSEPDDQNMLDARADRLSKEVGRVGKHDLPRGAAGV